MPVESTRLTAKHTAVAFVEAEGFVAVLDAADAMSRTARVRLGGVSRIGGGLVSISVAGELAQVIEAIEVGEETIRAHHGAAVRSVVFPRPCPAVAAIARRPALIG